MNIATTLSDRVVLDSVCGSARTLSVISATDKVYLAVFAEDGTTSRVVVNKAELLAALK